MKPNSVDHEATIGVYHTTCLEVHTEDIVHAERKAAAKELYTKLLHTRQVLLCEVARLKVQDFAPHLKTFGFDEKGIFFLVKRTTLLILFVLLLSEATTR